MKNQQSTQDGTAKTVKMISTETEDEPLTKKEKRTNLFAALFFLAAVIIAFGGFYFLN